MFPYTIFNIPHVSFADVHCFVSFRKIQHNIFKKIKTIPTLRENFHHLTIGELSLWPSSKKLPPSLGETSNFKKLLGRCPLPKALETFLWKHPMLLASVPREITEVKVQQSIQSLMGWLMVRGEILVGMQGISPENSTWAFPPTSFTKIIHHGWILNSRRQLPFCWFRDNFI